MQPMGSPAAVAPGQLLVSPSGPEKDRLWGQVRILTHRACHSSREGGMTGTQPHDTTAPEGCSCCCRCCTRIHRQCLCRQNSGMKLARACERHTVKTVCRQGPKNGVNVREDGSPKKMTHFASKNAAAANSPHATLQKSPPVEYGPDFHVRTARPPSR